MAELPSLLRTAFKGARTKLIPKGQIIMYQGDLPHEAFLLRSGVVKVHDIDNDGNDKILHLLRPWSILPLAFFTNDEKIGTRWYYTALTDCQITAIPAQRLIERLKGDNELTLQLMGWFSSEVHEFLVRLSSLGKTNARDKLLAALRFLSTYHSFMKTKSWCRVNFPVNHQMLADMTGITRESAAIIMKELQNEGLIRNPKLTVLEINRVKLDEI